jgi:hypothetical protein
MKIAEHVACRGNLEMYIHYWLENPGKSDYMEYITAAGLIILKYILSQ